MTRRGAFAAYLDIDHPDFEEFLQIRDIGNPIQNLFTGACIPDYWMQEMVDGDMEKRRIWAKVLESRQQKGLPYLFFTDNVNKNKPQVYKDKKMQITHSNLCIAGSDRVVSNYGYLTAKELHDIGTELTLFDGRNPVKSSPMKLREKDVPTYKVTLKNGMEHTITDYHKVKVVGYGGQYREVALKDLKVGDKVVLQKSKGLFGTEDNYDLAYLLGWYHSDGTQHEDRTFIDLWENSFDKLDEIQETFTRVYSAYGGNTYDLRNKAGEVMGQRHRDTPKFSDCQVREGSQAKKRLGTNLFSKNNLGFKKGEIPDWIWRSDERTQWRYIQSLLEGDGSVYMYDRPEKGSPIQLYYSSVDLNFIKQLQRLMYNLGIRPSIYKGRAGGPRLMPDGKGGQKLYETKQCYKLAIGNRPDCVKVNQMTGFLDRKGVKLELPENYRDNTRNYSPVESIEFHSNQDVYCPTVETEEHVFVCNGIQTFNCSEVSLIDTPDESFVCCLSSLNLELYDEWKNTDTVKLAIYFLDAVMSEFIENSAGIPGLEAVNKFARRHRALGLGVLGYHSYLQKNNIPFESMEAKTFNAKVFKEIESKARKASKELAKVYGEPELLKGYGLRNTTLMAIAPTTSSSAILGQTSPGVEPFASNYYKAGLAKGNFMRKNKYLEAKLEELGKNTEEVWRDIMLNRGSVQHLDFLDDHTKAVFRTFKEISQREIITQAVQRQRYIDQAQSINLNIPPDIPLKDVNALYIYAWQSGLKTLYYQRSESVAKNMAMNFNNCISCEA